LDSPRKKDICCNLVLGGAGYVGYKSRIRAKDVEYSKALLGTDREQHKIQHPTLPPKEKNLSTVSHSMTRVLVSSMEILFLKLAATIFGLD
jgi:hypothetical protein